MLAKGEQGAYHAYDIGNESDAFLEYLEVEKNYPERLFSKKQNFENSHFYIWFSLGIGILVLAFIAKVVWMCTDQVVQDFIKKKKQEKKGFYFVGADKLKHLKAYLASDKSPKAETVLYDRINHPGDGYEEITKLFPTDFKVIDPADESALSSLFGGECPDCFVDLKTRIVDDI